MRDIKIKDIVVGDKTIRIEVSYRKGEMNYFTGECCERGYYLSASPVEISDGCVIFTAFTGVCNLIEPTSRFSQKKLENIANNCLTDHKELIDIKGEKLWKLFPIMK